MRQSVVSNQGGVLAKRGSFLERNLWLLCYAGCPNKKTLYVTLKQIVAVTEAWGNLVCCGPTSASFSWIERAAGSRGQFRLVLGSLLL